MILVIDNYDSFTFNLVQYLGELGAETVVKRNDEIPVDAIDGMRPSAIVISPGPCDPAQAGISVPTVQRWGSTIPILGVCLGHQSIGEAYGGKVVRAAKVMHGKTSRVRHEGTDIFAGLPNPMQVMRYHSLVVEPSTLPAELTVLARAEDDPSEVHAVRHRTHPVWGVQFHPESIMTPDGKALLRNFLELSAA
ncbi:MAG TPA: aminodeoxychorismate/anthranilate synthase component II [Gemmatimonadaceae bacterium]|nr:aminodeoxychorismate/anthranilate synthase component II [Gemmatimonadaceae bacterium]